MTDTDRIAALEEQVTLLAGVVANLVERAALECDAERLRAEDRRRFSTGVRAVPTHINVGIIP